MNDPVITMGPTLANPEAFTTVPELREELRRANDLVLEMSERLHTMNTAAHHLSEMLRVLMEKNMAGETEKVVALLDKLQAHHMRSDPGKVH
jgi:hypothetical protein